MVPQPEQEARKAIDQLLAQAGWVVCDADKTNIHALEDGEPVVLLEALRNVAQAKGGMGALAKAAGVSRESLYKTLSRRGNPKIDTIMEILRALGLKLTIERQRAA